jgi:hypothetical protein
MSGTCYNKQKISDLGPTDSYYICWDKKGKCSLSVDIVACISLFGVLSVALVTTNEGAT